MNRKQFPWSARCWILLSCTCAGSLFSGECIANLRDSFFTGSKALAVSVLDPSNVVGYPFEEQIADLLGGS